MVNCDRTSSAAMVILERIANKLPARFGIPVMCLLINIPIVCVVSIFLLADSELYIKIIVGLVLFIVLNIFESMLGSWAERTDNLPYEAENTIIVEFSNHGNYGISNKNILLEYLLIGVGKMDAKYYLLACGGNKKVEQVLINADEIDQIKNYVAGRYSGVVWTVMKRKS